MSAQFRRFFLPLNYPKSVTDDYIHHFSLQFVQGVCNAILGVLATRSLLAGYGVGDLHALPGAAAIQWCLRDGVGHLTSLAVVGFMSSSFDAYCKQWRLLADVMNDIGLTLELLAPIHPPLFFLCTCLAVSAKSISGIAGGCSRNQIMNHFALRNNVGDVNAKSSSQGTVGNLLGLVIGMAVTWFLEDKRCVTQVLCIALLGCHIFCNWLSLHLTHMTSLNPYRLRALFDCWLRKEDCPRPAEVREPLLLGHWFRRMSPLGKSTRSGFKLCVASGEVDSSEAGYMDSMLTEKGYYVRKSESEGTVFITLHERISGDSRVLLTALATAWQYAENLSPESWKSFEKQMIEKGWNVNELLWDGPLRYYVTK